MRLFEIEKDSDNTVFFTFINANPPTFGYTRALDYMRELSGSSDSIAFLNPYQHNLRSPLYFDENISYVNKIFTKTTFDRSGNIENPIQALKYLSKKYSKIFFLTRDANVDDLSRMYSYAEQWGVTEFEIIGLKDSTRPLPTGTSKEASLRSVLDNDFEAFKKTIPSNDIKLVSEIFIKMRKRMIEGEREDNDNSIEEAIDTIFNISKEFSKLSHVLNESCINNAYGSKEINIGDNISTLSNLKFVFNPSQKNTLSLGKDNDGNFAILIKSDALSFKSVLDLNEKEFKKAISVYLKESTTSGNIGSVTSLFPVINKREIDYNQIMNSIEFDNQRPKILQIANFVINHYGYYDDNISKKLREML